MKFSKSKRIIFSLPLIAVSIFIFYLSSISQPPIPDFGFDWQDKVLHFIAFFVYGITGIIFSLVNFSLGKIKKTIIIVLFIGSIFGISDELHQYFVPGRDCSLFDWIADVIGILSSLILIKPLSNILSKYK
jgi:VanZ family protein